MNLKQLEAFVQVAKEKSFSKAAKVLFLTQPTVSAHIASLEKELNVRLFVRNTKEVELSEKGKKLFEYASQMVDLERQIERQFDYSRKQGSSLIKIAASTIPSQYLLPQALAYFGRKFPQVHWKIMETDSEKAIRQVIENRVDLGFTGTVLEKKHCGYIPFYEDELVLLTPNTETYLSYKKNPQRLEWIRQEDWLLREVGSGTRAEAERMLQKLGFRREELKIKASIENPETIKRLVRRGAGISILSKLAAKEQIEAGEILSFPLKSHGGKRMIYMVYNKNVQLSKAARDLIKTVTNIIKMRETGDTV